MMGLISPVLALIGTLMYLMGMIQTSIIMVQGATCLAVFALLLYQVDKDIK